MSYRCLRNQMRIFAKKEHRGKERDRCRDKKQTPLQPHTPQLAKHINSFHMTNRSHTQAPPPTHLLTHSHHWIHIPLYKTRLLRQIHYNLVLLVSLTLSNRLHNVGGSRLLLLVRIWNIIINRIQTFYLSPVSLPTYIWHNHTSLIRLKPFWVQHHKVLHFPHSRTLQQLFY